MSKNCPQDTFTTLAEKHLLLKSVVPGINIRRMTHYNYLLAKDQLKQQVRKKNGERIGSVVPGMREEKGTLPALGEKNRLVAMGEGGFGARKRSVPSFWPKKLNDVRKGLICFDRVRQSSQTDDLFLKSRDDSRYNGTSHVELHQTQPTVPSRNEGKAAAPRHGKSQPEEAGFGGRHQELTG